MPSPTPSWRRWAPIAKWHWRLAFFRVRNGNSRSRALCLCWKGEAFAVGWMDRIGSGGLAWTPYTRRAAEPPTACAQQHLAGVLQPVLRAPLGRDLAVD